MAKFWEPSEEELKKIESLAARGMEQQDIALCLGIHPGTLSMKKAVIGELDEAIKRGKAKGIARVTNALLKNVDIGNVTAQIFYLKTQAKWREQDDRDTAQETMKSLADSVKELAAKCERMIPKQN
jgi:hypothetical protein